MRKLFSWKLRRRVGRVAIFAMFLNLNLGCISSFMPDLDDLHQAQVSRAPRDGSTDMSASGCCSGGNSAELGLIRGCVCQINTNVSELESCCEELNVDIIIIDSKIDELFIDFRETWTAIDACCTGTGAVPVDLTLVYEDFRETWTILGDQSELAATGIDTLDEINTSTLSIIAWLKTIYAQSRGLIT